jgi:protoheme IX farnesyltransferase
MRAATDISQVAAAAIARPPARLATRSRLLDYLDLAKPRMNFLVLVTTAVGYYMAVRHPFQWLMLLHTLLGTAMTAAAASALNQIIEWRYDGLMRRTANRPLPAHRLAPREATLFAMILTLGGVTYLAIAVNLLTAALGAFTLATYVLVYTPLKRRTTLNTVIGAIPGAIPPVMGCTAVWGHVTPEAIALFLVLFLWQMPHFLAIAILYRDDYARAGFKMLPVVDREMTGRQMVLYAAALLPATLLPVPLHMAGMVYLFCALALGVVFLAFAIRCAASDQRTDARKLFLASILYLPLLLAAMMIDKV